MKTKKTNTGKNDGFTMVEVALALGIVGICIATMQGLIPAGIRVARDSTEQTACTTMMAAVATDLRYSASGSSSSPRFGIAFPDSGSSSATNIYLMEDGSQTLDAKNARFGVSVGLSNAPSSTVSSLTSAKIKVFWPSTASIGKEQGSVETLTAFNREMQKGGKYRSKKESSDNDDEHDGEHEGDDDSHHGDDREGDDD
ncbi:MAG: prepilin-type N-terminal cleavage/methylation domain-containing protein [bacterium]